MAVLGYLPKLKSDLGLLFVHNFGMVFSYKYSLFNALLIEKVSLSYFFPSQYTK